MVTAVGLACTEEGERVCEGSFGGVGSVLGSCAEFLFFVNRMQLATSRTSTVR